MAEKTGILLLTRHFVYATKLLIMGKIGNKTIALYLLTILTFLLLLCFAENLGYFHNADEYQDQAVEQFMVSSVVNALKGLDELIKAVASIVFIGIVLTFLSNITAAHLSACRIILTVERYGPPQFPKIFKYIAAYRI